MLVAEDDTQLRLAVSEFLLGEGFDVSEAENGAAALEMARAAPPDVLVLDLNMPQLDGSAVLQEWTASPNSRKFPYCWSRRGRSGPRRPAVRGAGESVKPFDMDVLLAVVDQLMAHPESPPCT